MAASKDEGTTSLNGARVDVASDAGALGTKLAAPAARTAPARRCGANVERRPSPVISAAGWRGAFDYMAAEIPARFPGYPPETPPSTDAAIKKELCGPRGCDGDGPWILVREIDGAVGLAVVAVPRGAQLDLYGLGTWGSHYCVHDVTRDVVAGDPTTLRLRVVQPAGPGAHDDVACGGAPDEWLVVSARSDRKDPRVLAIARDIGARQKFSVQTEGDALVLTGSTCSERVTAR